MCVRPTVRPHQNGPDLVTRNWVLALVTPSSVTNSGSVRDAFDLVTRNWVLALVTRSSVTRFPRRAGGRPPEGGWSPSGPPRKSGSRRCRLATLFVYGGPSGRSASRRSFGPDLRAGPSHSTHDVTRRLYNLHVIHDVIQRHRTGSDH